MGSEMCIRDRGSETDNAAINIFGERVLLLVDLADSTFKDFLQRK